MPPALIRLRLPPRLEQQAAKEAARLGIGPGRPIVTVHARESGYRASAGLRQRQWDEWRNANVASYFKAFRALVERGYTVVRLGDPTMTLPSICQASSISPLLLRAVNRWKCGARCAAPS